MKLPDAWFAWRNRLLASPGFQRLAARFPLTRPVARQRAQALFDLVAGFVYSQVLLACVRLRVFELLQPGPLPAAEIARRVGLPLEGTERLLAAAGALGLLEPRGTGWGLGIHGAALLGNPGVAAMIEHHASLYADLADPVALLRQPQAGRTELSRFWAYADPGAAGQVAPERASPYSALMSASQPLVAEEILSAYPLHRHRMLLDVGGGEGGFLAAAAARAPRLKLMLFDLPAVAERARSRLEGLGLAPRAAVVGGDFQRDPLPQGADVISLVRVVHDHDDPVAMTLLRAAHRALPPGGSLLLAEPLARTPGAASMGDAYFGIYLLAMGQGKPRSAEQLSGMLQAAGFEKVRRLPTHLPLQTSVLHARVPDKVLR